MIHKEESTSAPRTCRLKPWDRIHAPRAIKGLRREVFIVEKLEYSELEGSSKVTLLCNLNDKWQ